MGLGIQGGGLGVARYFAKQGAKVLVTDLRSQADLSQSIAKLKEYPSITYHLGEHHEEDFIHADYIVKGPSVRWDNIFIEQALKHRVPVIMETAHFTKHTKAMVIGVTGTRGKTTTTTCIYSTLKNFYTKGNVYLSGNIPGTCAIELLDITKENDIVVLELSSWQLSGFHREKISPQVAVFTNIYEDHFNYYENMQKYVYDKTAIFAYQKPNELFITTKNALEVLQSNRVDIPSQTVVCTTDDFSAELLHIRGDHNRLNAALALTTSTNILHQVDKQVLMQFISGIENIKFRQEIIAVMDDVVIVNDSTSTTPISTITAIETFADKEIVLVLGGNSKKLSMHDLVKTIEKYKTKIRLIVLLKGSMTDEIHGELSNIHGLRCTEIFEDFEEAIRNGVEMAKDGGRQSYLLFSPGATSFAQFRNEFDRGEKFNSIISDIMEK